MAFDAQYQYLLEPHTATAQLAYMTTKIRYSDATANQPVDSVDAFGNPLPNTNASDTINILRAKLTYVYQAKYGGSLGYFNRTGGTNSAIFDPTRVTGNASGNPATRGFTYEAFWTPVQYVRTGLQFTTYSRFNGSASNYDGLGRSAKDNNTLFFYVWGAF